MLNQNQINELLDIIDSQNIRFIGKQLGSKALSKKDRKILLASGIKPNSLPKIGKVDLAFKLGILSDVLKETNARNLSYKELKKYVSEGKYIPLTGEQKLALLNLKKQAYNDIKGLNEKIKQSIGRDVLEVDKLERAKQIRKIAYKEAEQAILNKESVRQLAKRIAKKTKDWTTNFNTISDYILHTAIDTGKAEGLKKRLGNDALCYKEVHIDERTCKHCVSLYLKPNGEPKIFKIKDLLANGTNIGRRQSEWKPVVGAMHPHCRCELVELPANSVWDHKKQMFVVERLKSSKRVERKSRAKITVTKF